MTQEKTERRGRARALFRRLVAATSATAAAVAGLAVPAGAANVAHGTTGTVPATAAATGGMLRIWGLGDGGELGNNTFTNSAVPVKPKLPAGTKITQVRGGFSFTLALTSAGTVYAWGNNSVGQLGNGTNTDSFVPVLVHLPAGTKVKGIRAGFEHALALTTTGQVFAWGDNEFGQLGNGTFTDSNVPVKVLMPAGVKVKALGAGSDHSLALASTGTAVFAWGDNEDGQLGNGSFSNAASPVQVQLPDVTVKSLAATAGASLAVLTDGRVMTWGFDVDGELGDNRPQDESPTPVFAILPSGTTVVGAVGMVADFLARTSDGRVLGWGNNAFGELGDGTFLQRNVPTLADLSLPAGVTVKGLAAGDREGFALISGGKVLAWGEGDNGELGNGMFTNSPTPVQVSIPNTLVVIGLGAGPRSHIGAAIVRKAA